MFVTHHHICCIFHTRFKQVSCACKFTLCTLRKISLSPSSSLYLSLSAFRRNGYRIWLKISFIKITFQSVTLLKVRKMVWCLPALYWLCCATPRYVALLRMKFASKSFSFKSFIHRCFENIQRNSQTRRSYHTDSVAWTNVIHFS